MSGESQIRLLNAKELIAQTNLHNEIDPSVLVRGLKAKYPKNTDEERATIKSYHGRTIFLMINCNMKHFEGLKKILNVNNISDDLRKVLEMERVALKCDRSIATLDNGVIKVVKRQGKWDSFESTGSYLEAHEALFLMEMVSVISHLWITS